MEEAFNNLFVKNKIKINKIVKNFLKEEKKFKIEKQIVIKIFFKIKNVEIRTVKNTKKY